MEKKKKTATHTDTLQINKNNKQVKINKLHRSKTNTKEYTSIRNTIYFNQTPEKFYFFFYDMRVELNL